MTPVDALWVGLDAGLALALALHGCALCVAGWLRARRGARS